MSVPNGRLAYPITRIEDEAYDTLANIAFPNPYRWLEADSEEVRLWQRTQANLASSYVREWPQFQRLERLVSKYSTGRRDALPRYAGGYWFRAYMAEGASQASVVIAEAPMGEGRVLFDPETIDAARPPYLSWIAPAPNGRTLAIGLCSDGSENNTIRLIDVATCRPLVAPPSQVLMDNWTGGVHWLPDSSGFFFSAITGPATEFSQQVYLHRRLPTPTTQLMNVPWTTSNDYRMVVVSRDGRYAVALERMNSTIPVAISPLDMLPLTWTPFITSIAGTVAGDVLGTRYIAVTDVGSPRGRLVAIPINAKDPNDPSQWHDLFSESDATLRTVTPVGKSLYLTEFVDTYARIRIVDFDGESLGEVPLPCPGAVSELPFTIMNLVPKGHPDKFLFYFSSLTVSQGLYSHTPGSPELETLEEPRVRLERSTVEDCWAESLDGTRIPYHIVRRADLEPNPSQPTLIFAYGGFNYPLVPQFPGPMAAFVAAGGAFIHAHLRGGGEFGLDWWQGGRFGNKQNSYDDLYAVAEDLIRNRRCTPQSLAVTGGSNGGLTAGVALTQRPELWAAVVPRVPRLDLIGACRTSYGRRSTQEDRAVNLDDPNEVRRLATFSPYHLVRDGVHYPAVFIDAGDTDPRCPPQDARKFAAHLQRSSASNAPVLLHVWENIGHGWATDKRTAVLEHTEWLAFILRELGVEQWTEESFSRESAACLFRGDAC
jgi:prolyl oligopeptidase